MMRMVRKAVPAVLLLWFCIAPAVAGVDEDFKKAQEDYYRGPTDKALPALKKLAEGGHQPAMLLLAEDMDRSGDWEEALAYYRKLAEKGDAQAEYRIGVFYAFGYGVPQDNAQALNWISGAAEKGNPFARNTWVRAYLKQGPGLTLDPAAVDKEKALAWLKRSAEAEYVPAMEALADASRNGKYGLPVDVEQAKGWEAKIDAIKAEYKKADLAWQGADFTAASQILLKLANKDYAPAWALLGYMSEKTVFLEEAAKFYRHSAEQGWSDGEFFLGAIYSNGYGVKKDGEQALLWMTRAAEQGHVQAIAVVANAYANKKGLGLDEKTATDEKTVYWLKKAADNNNIDSIKTLLDAYQNRKLGLQSDPEQIGLLEGKLQQLQPGSSKKKRRNR